MIQRFIKEPCNDKIEKNEPGSRAQKSSQRYHSNQPWGKKVDGV